MRQAWTAGLAGLFIFGLPAMAAEIAALVPAEDGAAACWSRVYDAAHLAAHPNQKVSEMAFSVSYTGETQDYAPQHSFWLSARLRDGTRGENTGPCYESEGKILCGVECDGGYVLVEPRSDGSVMLDLETAGFIYLSGGCGTGEEGGFALEAGKDDKEFLLRPDTAKSCKAAFDQ